MMTRTLGRRKQARRPGQGVAGWGGTGPANSVKRRAAIV